MPCSPKPIHKLIACVAVMAVLLLVTGCGGVAPRTPVPAELTTKVEIPGIPHARFWGDEWPEWSKNALQTALESTLAKYPSLYNTQHNYLAISGGRCQRGFWCRASVRVVSGRHPA